MFQRILVPTDGTEVCALALDAALELARLGGGAIIGLHASPARLPAGAMPADTRGDARGDMPAGGAPDTIDPAYTAWYDEHERQAGDALGYVRRRARDAGVASDTVLVRGAAPHDAIERVARERGCDLVVLAAHARRGLRARLLGGEAGSVLAHGTVPLLFVR